MAHVKKEEAKRLIQREWRDWAKENIPADKEPDGTDGLVFFGYLQRVRPDLLSFRHSGDKWQAVNGWLLQIKYIRG